MFQKWGCIYIYKYTSKNVCIYVYTHIHTCIYICMYIIRLAFCRWGTHSQWSVLDAQNMFPCHMCVSCVVTGVWVTSRTRMARSMSHGLSHVNESCHMWKSHVTCQWVMLYMRESPPNNSCHIQEWHVSRIMAHTNESGHLWMSHVTYYWVMPYLRESCHVRVMSRLDESGHVERVIAHKHETCHMWMSHVTCESCHTCMSPLLLEWVMSHTRIALSANRVT